MSPPIRFIPASALTLDAVADLYTRTFADYFYEAIITAADMAKFIRVEQLVLERSPVMSVGAEPVGLATVGLRNEQAFCKGFGISVPFRGRGLASALCQEVIRQARLAGAQRLGLGVMVQNERAVRTYLSAGLQVMRELLSFEWNLTPHPPLPHGEESGPLSLPALRDVTHGWERVGVRESSPTTLLAHFDALHPIKPIWGRDLRSLRAMDGLRGLAMAEGSTPTAFVLFETGAAGAAWIADIAAAEVSQAVSLLTALQQLYTCIVCSNEPAASPMIAAFRAAGFSETLRRYEMTMEL